MITPQAVTVPSGPAPIFDGALGRSFEFIATSDAVAILRNLTPGALYTFDIAQDGMGGHLFSFSGAAVNAAEVSTAPLIHTTQTFLQRADGKMYALSPGALS